MPLGWRPSLIDLMVSLGVKQDVYPEAMRAQELCDSRGGRPLGSPTLIVRTVSVDVKQH